MTVYRLGGGFKRFFICTPKIWEMIQFDSYFSKGLKPPTNGAFEWLEAPTGIATDTGII